MTHHPIAIIGGGLGGLTAARVLYVHGIESAVFELEADRHVRTRGGMVDMHEENGQRAVRAAGLWDEFVARIHPGGESMRILDRDATVLRAEEDDGTLDRPEIDRGTLRDLFLDALPGGTVRWGRVTSSSAPTAPGRGCARCGRTRARAEPGCGSSRTTSTTQTSGIPPRRRHPAEAAAMGGGMLFALHDGVGILGHRETGGSLHVYVGHRADERWVDTIDATATATATATAKEKLLDLLDG